MATRRQLAAQRNKLAVARATLAEERAVMAAHLKICSRCKRSGPHTHKLCDEGWQFAKLITRATNRVRKLEAAADMAARQGTLW